MSRNKMMTLDEKLAVGMKAHEYLEAGDKEEAVRILKQMPLAPHLAKFAKEWIGADFLMKGNWNLAEAEAKFGPDWLAQ